MKLSSWGSKPTQVIVVKIGLKSPKCVLSTFQVHVHTAAWTYHVRFSSSILKFSLFISPSDCFSPVCLQRKFSSPGKINYFPSGHSSSRMGSQENSNWILDYPLVDGITAADGNNWAFQPIPVRLGFLSCHVRVSAGGWCTSSYLLAYSFGRFRLIVVEKLIVVLNCSIAVFGYAFQTIFSS